jgi:hypothetical protein
MNRIDKLRKQPSLICKWIDEYPFLNDNDFENVFCLPFRVVRNTKLQTFQYKLINWILETNKHLISNYVNGKLKTVHIVYDVMT